MIDRSDPRTGEIDHGGRQQLYRLERDLARRIEQRRADGKDPFDLFDPTKPDYVGRPEALQPYAFAALRQHLENREAELRAAASASTAEAGRRATPAELSGARDALRRGADHRAVIKRFSRAGIDFSAL